MNTKKKPIEHNKQRKKTSPKQESKQQLNGWDMWEALHDGVKNQEHERPEMRMTR